MTALNPEALDTIEALIGYVEDPSSPASEAVKIALVVAKVHAPRIVAELRRLRTENEEQAKRIDNLLGEQVAGIRFMQERDALQEQISALRAGVLNVSHEELVRRVTEVTAPEWKAGHWIGNHDDKVRAPLKAKIDAALVEVGNTDLSTFEALQEDLADRVRAALTGEATT